MNISHGGGEEVNAFGLLLDGSKEPMAGLFLEREECLVPKPTFASPLSIKDFHKLDPRSDHHPSSIIFQ